MPSLVIRHVGGLETVHTAVDAVAWVIRQVGGLDGPARQDTILVSVVVFGPILVL